MELEFYWNLPFPDPTIDRIKTSGIPIVKQFLGPAYEIELTIKKRGVAPLGGGEVHFKCPVIRSLRTLQVFIIKPFFLSIYNY